MKCQRCKKPAQPSTAVDMRGPWNDEDEVLCYHCAQVACHYCAMVPIDGLVTNMYGNQSCKRCSAQMDRAYDHDVTTPR